MKIKLSSGRYAEIDAEDYHLTVGWGLYPVRRRNNTYVEMCRWNSSTKRQEHRALHRVVMKAERGQLVCHLDGNGMNCQKLNLAFGNHHTNGSSHRHKNAGASSAYRGVHINNGRGKKWTVMFWDKGTCIYLGRFDSEVEAARTYDKEAARRFGRFAQLNAA